RPAAGAEVRAIAVDDCADGGPAGGSVACPGERSRAGRCRTDAGRARQFHLGPAEGRTPRAANGDRVETPGRRIAPARLPAASQRLRAAVAGDAADAQRTGGSA